MILVMRVKLLHELYLYLSTYCPRTLLMLLRDAHNACR